LGLRSRLR